MTDKPLLNEGKTKRILDNGDGTVDVENKDAITAGDGAKKDSFEGKGVASTRTTCNVFELLERKGIPTHYLERVDARTFRAKRVTMIPLECVCRRILFGSWLERNPDDVEATILAEPTFELFYKDDGMHDPLVQVGEVEGYGSVVGVYYAHAPLAERPSYLLAPWLVDEWVQYFGEIERLTREIFLILEEAMLTITVDDKPLTLVDFKVEFGLTEDGQLVLADVVDNDSWRAWMGGVKEGQVDKQAYRDLAGHVMSEDERASIKKKFDAVAVATDNFALIE